MAEAGQQSANHMIKKILYVLALVSLTVAIPVLEAGCSTKPDARHVQYATLKAVGDTADAAVAESAHLYQQGMISAVQANRVRDLYDNKFQKTYSVAVAAAKADLSSVASPELLDIATQLANLVASFQTKSP